MAPDETDDVHDADFTSLSRRRGVWSPAYLRRFTRLLQDNPVLLERLSGYPRDDPVHERKRRAVESARLALGLESAEQVRGRIVTFRKFAANKFRQFTERLGPGATPAAMLRAVPRWLRDLEPHLSLWTPRTSKRLDVPAERTPAAAPPAAPPAASPPPPPAASPPPGERVAQALVSRARALRSLEARVVCARVEGIPPAKQDDLKYIWWRMLDVVRKKISLLGAGVEGEGAGVELAGSEAALAELVLLFDDTICTLPDAEDHEGMQALVGLFHAAQQFGLEDGEGAPGGAGGPAKALAWRQAHQTYRAYLTNHNIKGFGASFLLMQRRWHELKRAACRELAAYARAAPPAPPAPAATLAPPRPLYVAIAKRFPHVVTAPMRSWRDLVNCGAVVEDQKDGTADGAAGACEYERLEDAGRDLEGEEGEGEDDLVVVEREIETIDLDGEEAEPAGGPPRAPDDQQEQVRSRRQSIADELERDIEWQLSQLQPREPSEGRDERSEQSADDEPSEGASRLAGEPSGTPTFIYDSDEDLDCWEDRNKNIELIASQICSAVGEQLSRVRAAAAASDSDSGGGGGGGSRSDSDDAMSAGGDGGEEEGAAIDEKLLMDARVRLERVDSSARWRRHATPAGRVALARLLPPAEPAPVAIKQEKMDEDSAHGSRRVKAAARRRIAELLRDDEEPAPRRLSNAKKIQLQDIEEVRKSNRSLLTAQVAPLAAGAALGELSPAHLACLLRRLSAERAARGSAHCCPARRERAVNAARRRAAARAGRPPPAPLPLHKSSACGRSGAACACCCRRAPDVDALQRAAAARALRHEAAGVAAALQRLAQESADGAPPGGAGAKKTPKPKRDKRVGVTAPSPERDDPLQEWIRQKNLNQKYFNLNLSKPPAPPPAAPPPAAPSQPETSKLTNLIVNPAGDNDRRLAPLTPAPPPAPALPPPTLPPSILKKQISPDFKKFILIPTNNSDPRAKSKIVFSNVDPNLWVSSSCTPTPPPAATPGLVVGSGAGAEGTTIVESYPFKKQPALQMKGKQADRARTLPLVRINPKPTGSETSGSAASAAQQNQSYVLKDSVRIAPKPSTVKTITVMTQQNQSNAPIIRDQSPSTVAMAMPSRSLIVRAPSRALPGKTLVRLSAVSSAPTAALGSTSQVKIAPKANIRTIQTAPRSIMTPATVPIAPKPAMAPQTIPIAPKPVMVPSSLVGQKVQLDMPRGTGMTVTKISSVAAASRSLLKLTAAGVPRAKIRVRPPVHQQAAPAAAAGQVILNTATASDSQSESYTSPLLEGGAVLTKITQENTSSPAPAGTEAEPPLDMRQYFTDERRKISLERFLASSSTQKRFMLQVVDMDAPPMGVGGHHHLLASSALPVARPAHWTLGPRPARLVLDAEGGAPAPVPLEGKLYIKVKNEPLRFAEVLWAVRSAGECRRLLAAGAQLQLVRTRDGNMTPLSLAPHNNALCCSDLEAAKALAQLLNGAPPAAGAGGGAGVVGGGGDGGSRALSNARAEAVMSLNNTRRRPIELVEVASDDEEPPRAASKQFKGLENFEDLDDFEL